MTPPGVDPHGPASRRLGRRAERLAAAFFARRGYRIAACNLRTQLGEIDLLVRRRRTWVAVEVKARSDHPAPERALRPDQLDRLSAAILALAPGLRPRPRRLRIDAIAVRVHRDDDRGIADVWYLPGLRCFDGGGRAIPGTCIPEAAGYQWPTDERTLLMPTLAEQIIPRRKLLLMATEMAIFAGVLFVGTSIWPFTKQPFALAWNLDLLRCLLTCVTVAVICQAALSYNDLYDWKVSQNRAELPNRLMHSCGYALVLMAALVLVVPELFFFPGLQNVSRETWKLIVLLALGFLLIWFVRAAFHWFFYKWRFGEQVLVLGCDDRAQEIGQLIVNNPLSGFELVGMVDESAEAAPVPDEAAPAPRRVLGNVTQLFELCEEHGVARVVVSLHERRGRVPLQSLLTCRMAGIQVEEREAMFERLTGRLAVESMRPSYLIYGSGFQRSRTTLALKRVIDILFSLIGLLLSSPLWLLAALLVRTTSRGPVFFTQERVSQDGRVFRLVKFRTMRADAEKESGPVWAADKDPRITGIGRWLRLTRIDEIPQFLNILIGQMSFVGPRPERPHFVEQLSRQIPFYPLRHTVKPGLTGWAQVRHPYGASVEDATEKLRYDLYYIKNMSLLFDLNIILRTTGVILLGKGAR